MFYNREIEIQKLQKAISSKASRLIVIFGRRRCGKSTLIKQVLTTNDVYFAATLSDSTLQLQELATAIAGHVPGFDQVSYPNWNSFLMALNNASRKPFTLCLDEFPYLVKTTPDLPSILQRFIDNNKKRMFHIILCGSSQQMMNSMVLDSTSPLYGRANEILKIKPLQPYWLTKAIKINCIEAVEEYAVWGGVPRYWEIRQEYKSLKDALKGAILDKYGILHEEPARLFIDDMRESIQAFSILSIIAKGANRISEIAGRIGKPATQITRTIDSLIKLGYIRRDVPFGESYKSSKHGLYKIADPFISFYFTFVVPDISRLEMGLTTQVAEKINSIFNLYVSKHWEELCRQSVPFITIDGKKFDLAQRWWSTSSKGLQGEIDIIAESIDKTTLLIGECKWSDKINEKQIILNLQKKSASINTNPYSKIIFRIFTRTGNTKKNIIDAASVIKNLK